MKNSLLFLFLVIVCYPVCAGNGADTIFVNLDLALKNKQKYVQLKEERIANFKKIKSSDLSDYQEYDYNKSLYKEYQKFNSDSAIFYVRKNLTLANKLHNLYLEETAQLQLANLYSSSGRYRESEEILKSINKKLLPQQLLSDYYEGYREFFSHYLTNSYNPAYVEQSEKYRDSLFATLNPQSLKYKIVLAEKNISDGKIDSTEKELIHLLKQTNPENPQYAMIAYLLGNIYKKKENLELKKAYFAISATADIKNSIKDNASIQELALVYFELGDIDTAYKLTKSAIEDAIFCNVQFRTLQMSEVYSIINTAYLDKEAKRKSQLQLYLLLISILALFLVLAVIYVYKQMKKVSRIKEELSKTSEELVKLNADISKTNNQLQERNAQLSESNHIKEEYIAHFFSLCSTYINKLENYRITLNKKATAKQFEELYKILKSTTLVDNELEELYKNFDTIFLNLYPTFVKDFNSLLINEEQIILKQGELLNTELRIFALIRLGINDSVKIAAFLRYSLSTIYNYRTRARNKAAVSRNEFEEMVIKIGLIVVKTQ
ncbi:DUF6377 domain-containing protein [Flavobacterium sp. LS1R49]|uniref:DUF6377 domain-containing protein n=1 Tax=Flavobacterium shii TaxID=2987687 RepID=A0A9X2ZA22_9FLAO|nr:DUF6377 domain-containing protein [Flavobacterium shii]MCV9927166.1 DUF6377 domain-containing protein [Flavobacterium shii]